MAKRTKMIGVPVTPEEHRKFKQLAESQHFTFSELVRQLLYKALESRQSA